MSGGSVTALAISGSAIYAGGSFTSVNGGTVRNYLAAIDLTSGIATAWNPNMSSSVSALAISGSSIYAGGSFTSVNGGTARNYLAAIDLTSGTATAWNPNMSGGSVTSLVTSGSNIYAGGYFTSASNKLCGGICIINQTTGISLP